MILWSIQAKEAYDKMLETGAIRADEEHLLFEGLFKENYIWMAEQMKKRIGQPPKDVKYPVWAWYQFEGKRKRLDMRVHARSSEKGEEIVLLTIDVPNNQVLLSDFDYWHFVLNDHPITNDDYKKFSKEEKEKSWEQIFDYNCLFDDENIDRICTQATMWEIKEEWILKAEHFKTY